MQEELNFRKCDGSRADFEILKRIHRTTMEKPIVATMGVWDERFQSSKLASRYAEVSSTLKFLMIDGEEVGTFNYWERTFEDGIFYFIEQFYLLPHLQGTGTGSKMLNAHLKDKATRLSVLNGDPERQSFYRKRGFVPYKVEVERTYFQWNPVTILNLQAKKVEVKSSLGEKVFI